MWGFLVASRCIFILIMTLLDHRNTVTTKKLDFKNSHLTSVGAIWWRRWRFSEICNCRYADTHHLGPDTESYGIWRIWLRIWRVCGLASCIWGICPRICALYTGSPHLRNSQFLKGKGSDLPLVS